MTTMNTPGNDFYQYVNSGWLNSPDNKIPDDYPSWGGFTKLHDEGLHKQIAIINELKSRDINELTSDEKKVLSIWHASENRFRDWNEGKCDMQHIINEIKYMENMFNNDLNDQKQHIEQLASYLHYTQCNGISNVLDFDKGSNLDDVNQVVLDISATGLSLPSCEYYLDPKYEDKLTQFKEYLSNVKSITEKNADIKLNDNFVNNIINFETKIARYTMKPDQQREYDKYYTNTTLNNLHTKINELRSLDSKKENYDDDMFYFIDDKLQPDTTTFFETLYELFDFRVILTNNRNKYFEESENRPHEHHIVAYDGDAIRRCLRLIFDLDNKTEYKSYLQYKIINEFGRYCSKELDDENFDFFGRKLNGQLVQKPEEKRNIAHVNAIGGELLGKLFVEKYFPEDSKQNVKNMIEIILSEMRTSLYTNDWLTQETKDKAQQKLSKFRYKIGYPDVWKDYSLFDATYGDDLYTIMKKFKTWVLCNRFYNKINSKLDKEEWLMEPQTVNAYFMPTQNEIVFPAAIMQPPFYCKNISDIDFDFNDELSFGLDNDLIVKSANYGAIGAVIAHEITHGYDDKGRKFDEDGNLNNWWNDTDVELFNKKCDLLTESVKRYKYVDDEGNTHGINPQLTMGENLADIGGMSLSLKGLLTELKDVADIKQYCRIFFKSWANVWKQNIKKEKRLMLLSIDPHSPTDFRGNLVQHIDKFYDGFDVNKGDNMYLEPEHRMTMW